jgi:hypothetical protein
VNAPRIDEAELAVRFTYHPPSAGQVPVYEDVRRRAFDYATFLAGVVPQSRELSLAITALEEAVMWANAGIARRST